MPDPRRRHPAFTLTELLVVIGILVLLFGLLAPTLIRALGTASRTKVAAELAGISTSLEAYRTDFGDYPRFGQNPANPLDANSAGERGARLLARALVGPAPANDPNIDHDPSSYSGSEVQDKVRSYLAACAGAFQDGLGDNAQPFGFKQDRQVLVRPDSGGTQTPVRSITGKSYQPYLDPERFAVRELPESAPSPDPEGLGTWITGGFRYGPNAVLLDSVSDKPILYYPANPRPAPPTSTGGLAAEVKPGDAGRPRFNTFDGYNLADKVGLLRYADPETDAEKRRTNGETYLAEMLGDADGDGSIEAGETLVATGPFLLIASGGGSGSTGGDYVVEPVTNFEAAGQP